MSGGDRTSSRRSAAMSRAPKRRASSTRSRSRAERRCSNMSRAERIFRALLRLFPAEFRGDFGDDMAATFTDQRRDVLARGGARAALRLWWETLHGILTTAPREHLDLLRGDVRDAL